MSISDDFYRVNKGNVGVGGFRQRWMLLEESSGGRMGL